jgi:[ribosomal protein S5]-alanine N-acetyltransferase
MNLNILPIETDRLLLRDFKPGDFEAFYTTTNHPEYQKYYPERETTRVFLETIFQRILAYSEKSSRLKYQLAICLQTGELVGTCGVRVEDLDSQQASFGCAIGRRYWGKGYAYEASRRIIDFGFACLPIHRIYAETISQNNAARVLAERLGMRLEGELKEHKYFRGRWWNTSIYAVLKKEWMQRT